MNDQERCFCELAPLYALDLLTEEERVWVERQAAASPELATELAEIQATVGAISYSVPAVPVPTDLKARLFERLDQTPPVPEVENALSEARPMIRPLNRSPRSWTDRGRSRLQGRAVIPAFVGTAIVGILVLGVDNYRLRQTAEANKQVIATLQQPNTVYTLRGTEQAAKAFGTVIANPKQNSLVILVQNLPELAPDRAYRLWAIPQDRTQPTYCGQFSSREAVKWRWSPPQAVCTSSTVRLLMTAELVSSPLLPQGTLVMKSSI
jgi:hypothetical protein